MRIFRQSAIRSASCTSGFGKSTALWVDQEGHRAYYALYRGVPRANYTWEFTTPPKQNIC